MSRPPCRSILVANRGEIALRVQRTAREMGIETIAVYSEPDERAPHVLAADRAVALGGTTPADSYLDVDKILAAARATGAEAVHPGYGFLSEKGGFARACRAEGLRWIGPPPAAIEAMGDKAVAREMAEAAGVPAVPGGVRVESAGELRRVAQRLGFPLLLKAAAGGGGKGMRPLDGPDQIDDAWAAARREAALAFGDDSMLVETFIRPARHVEVQLVADDHGTVLTLGERECSLQRRHQKIIEESPSPAVGADLRRRLEEAARALARQARYRNAGTVEFLVDSDDNFYFLEMNTRLQVEHPVTECVRGVDLVRLQIEVAAGARLPQVWPHPPAGHAIEARLYAEDPGQNFLPTTGRVHLLRWPLWPGVRIDAGIAEGSDVTADYDPMLAKVIAWSTTRESARQRLVAALRGTHILGVTTNQAFLCELLEAPFFREGATFTHTVNAALDELGRRLDPPEALLAAALLAPSAATTAHRPGAAPLDGDRYSPWSRLGPWQPLEDRQ